MEMKTAPNIVWFDGKCRCDWCTEREKLTFSSMYSDSQKAFKCNFIWTSHKNWPAKNQAYRSNHEKLRTSGYLAIGIAILPRFLAKERIVNCNSFAKRLATYFFLPKHKQVSSRFNLALCQASHFTIKLQFSMQDIEDKMNRLWKQHRLVLHDLSLGHRYVPLTKHSQMCQMLRFLKAKCTSTGELLEKIELCYKCSTLAGHLITQWNTFHHPFMSAWYLDSI